jgi:hypothetical protein
MTVRLGAVRGRCRPIKDLPDGRGADLVAETGELAVDASVAPGGIVDGQAHDQGAEASWNAGSAGSGGLGDPAAGDEMTVPTQDRGPG